MRYGTTGVGLRIGITRNAFEDSETAKIHGDVLHEEGAEEGEGEVPSGEGGARVSHDHEWLSSGRGSGRLRRSSVRR